MFAIQACRLDESLLGETPAIRRVGDQLQRAARTEVAVLITGESGTGKGLAARLLHRSSARGNHNFLQVNCSAMTQQIFSGDDRCSEKDTRVTGAGVRSGPCSTADKGTLFLDEIGELDLALQPMFLQALQDCQKVRFGSTTEPFIDIRLICSTNHDLEVEITRGGFRADLFHRINVVRIHMPALRERASDIPVLMEHFLAKYASSFGRSPPPLTASFLKRLSAYHWPGNVRELENMARRYVVLGGEEQVLVALQQSDESRPLLPMTFDLTTPLRVQTKRALQHLEKTIILGVLEAHRWNRRKTARSLNISYRALLYKIKEVGLPRASPLSQELSPPTIHAVRDAPDADDVDRKH